MGLLELGEKIEQESRFYKDLRALQHAADVTKDFLVCLAMGRNYLWQADRRNEINIPKDAPCAVSNIDAQRQHILEVSNFYKKIEKIINDRIAEIRAKCSRVVQFLAPSPRIKRKGMRYHLLMYGDGNYRLGLNGEFDPGDALVINQAELICFSDSLEEKDVEGIRRFCKCAIISALFIDLSSLEEVVTRDIENGVIGNGPTMIGTDMPIYFDRPDIFRKTNAS